MFHVKPRPITVLQRWMTENKYSDTKLADALTGLMPLDYRVRPGTIAKWRLGFAMPRKEALRALATLSGGIVDANSFVAAVSPDEVPAPTQEQP